MDVTRRSWTDKNGGKKTGKQAIVNEGTLRKWCGDGEETQEEELN